MTKCEVTVISLIGLPRSGTTIAAEFLASHNEYFNCGELQSLMTRSIVRHGKCQCGETVFTCDFWSTVLGSLSPSEVESLKWLRSHLFTVASMLRLGWYRGKLPKAVEALRKLYRIISSGAKGKVLIDTSKNPLWHYVVQLVMHRNVFYAISWHRGGTEVIASFEGRRQVYHGRYFLTYLMFRKLLFAKHRQRLWQDYGAFVASPGKFLESVDAVLGYKASGILQGRDYFATTFRRDAGHSVAGNPSRIVKGVISIQPVSSNSQISRSGKLLAQLIDFFK